MGCSDLVESLEDSERHMEHTSSVDSDHHLEGADAGDCFCTPLDGWGDSLIIVYKSGLGYVHIQESLLSFLP